MYYIICSVESNRTIRTQIFNRGSKGVVTRGKMMAV